MFWTKGFDKRRLTITIRGYWNSNYGKRHRIECLTAYLYLWPALGFHWRRCGFDIDFKFLFFEFFVDIRDWSKVAKF